MNEELLVIDSINDELRFDEIDSKNGVDDFSREALFIKVTLYDSSNITVCSSILPIEITTTTEVICASLRQKIDVDIAVLCNFIEVNYDVIKL